MRFYSLLKKAIAKKQPYRPDEKPTGERIGGGGGAKQNPPQPRPM